MKSWLEEVGGRKCSTFRCSDMEQTITRYRVIGKGGPKVVYMLEYGPNGAQGWDALIPACEANSVDETIAALDRYLGE